MSVLHIPLGAVRHASVPNLWRARCSCGHTFYGRSSFEVRHMLQEHIAEETPIPDEILNECFDSSPDSEAARRKRES